MTGLLLAFALGVFPGQGATQVVKVVVRDEGKPRPFIFQVRTKDDRRADVPWEYLPAESFSYFPSRLLTSPPGRIYTVRLPSSGLKRYGQICARSEPTDKLPLPVDPSKVAPGGSSGFSVALALQSCMNLPTASK